MTVSYIDPQNGSDTSNPLGTEAAPRRTVPTQADNMVMRFKRGTRYDRTGQYAITAQGVIMTDYGNLDAPRPIFSSIHAASSSSFPCYGDTIWANIDFDLVDRTGLETSASNVGQNCVVLGRRGNGASPTQCVSGIFLGCGFHRLGNNAINAGVLSADADYAQACPVVMVLGCDFDTLGNDAFYGSVRDYLEMGHNTATNIGTRADSNPDFCNIIFSAPDYVWVHDNYIDHTLFDLKHLVMLDLAAGQTGGLAIIERNIGLGIGAASPHTQAAGNVGFNLQMRSIVRHNYLRGTRLMITEDAVSRGGSEFHSNIVDYYGSGTTAPAMALSAPSPNVHNNTVVSRNRLVDVRGVAFASTATDARLSRNLFVGFDKAITTTGPRGYIGGGNNRFASCGTRYWDQTNSVVRADGTDDAVVTDGQIGYSAGAIVKPPANALIDTMAQLDNRVPDFWGRFAPEGVGYIGALMERGL